MVKRFCPKGHDTFLVGRAANKRCYECSKASISQWHQSHPEKMVKAQAKWWITSGKEYRKGYAQKNSMKVLEQNRRRWWKGVLLSPGIPFTSADYERVLKKQNGKCANMFCQAAGKLHMDHDHKTNFFRGLICARCNWALGLCQDDTNRLVGLAAYLKETQNKCL